MPYLTNWTPWWWNLPMCILQEVPFEESPLLPWQMQRFPIDAHAGSQHTHPDGCTHAAPPIWGKSGSHSWGAVLSDDRLFTLFFDYLGGVGHSLGFSPIPLSASSRKKRHRHPRVTHIHYPLHHHSLWWGLWSIVSSQEPEDSIWNLFGSGECQGLRRPESRESAR